MAKMSHEEKRAILARWKQQQTDEMAYLLDASQVRDLFSYLEEKLEKKSCDHTLRHTKAWIEAEIPEECIDAILVEIQGMGGYCDCEVLFNCYEDMGLDE